MQQFKSNSFQFQEYWLRTSYMYDIVHFLYIRSYSLHIKPTWHQNKKTTNNNCNSFPEHNLRYQEEEEINTKSVWSIYLFMNRFCCLAKVYHWGLLIQSSLPYEKLRGISLTAKETAPETLKIVLAFSGMLVNKFCVGPNKGSHCWPSSCENVTWEGFEGGNCPVHKATVKVNLFTVGILLF